MTKVAQATREVQRVLRLGLRVLLKRPKLRLELRRPEVGARNHTASKAKSAKRAAVPLPKKSAAAVAASAVLARTLKERAKAKPSAARTALRRRGRLSAVPRVPASRARTGSRWKRCTVRHSASETSSRVDR